MEWYRNTGSVFASADFIAVPPRAIDPLEPPRLFDIDGDGIEELVTTDSLVLRHDRDTGGVSIARELIFNLGEDRNLDYQVKEFVIADYDSDGDEDVVALVNRFSDSPPFEEPRQIVVLSERDEEGRLGPAIDLLEVTHVYRASPYGGGLAVSDVDSDGDMDILLGSPANIIEFLFEGTYGGVYLFENRLEGDVNNDQSVDFADFLALSNNFGLNDAAWEDGDLNADQVVDFADFLLLSQNFGTSRG
jgi:hypothetical protein